ncbi:MAG: tetratricopeptide repeat protein [Armatimonas sp.]
MSNPPWTICMLGRLVAIRGDVSLYRFRTRQTGGVLAYLAYFMDRPHPREVLMDLFWPEADIDSARNRLNIVLSSIRQTLSTEGNEPVFISDHHQIRFNPALFTTDVNLFESRIQEALQSPLNQESAKNLLAAINLYQGPLLPGHYDPWIPAEQARLSTRFAEAVQVLSTYLVQQGRSSEARALLQTANTRGVELELTLPESRPESPRWRDMAPLASTRFIGRETERTEVCDALFSGARLVTLLGEGGIGKTRLSREIASACREFFRGRVCFVSLVGISDASALPVTILESLRRAGAFETPPSGTPQEALATLLATAPTLLILDNFEQLPMEAAEVVTTLLEAVPTLQCLVTSRRTLRLSVERLVRLPPLSLPPQDMAAQDLSGCEAVQLFMERAQLFPDKAAPLSEIGELCRLLEGIPLAIELAAARSSVLSPGRMCTEIVRRREWLYATRIDIPERHSSLWASMEWSISLLEPAEKELLAKLSVFQGGWSVDAAQAVCEIPLSPLIDSLQKLIESSLVYSTTGADGERRFSMLESLREYAAGDTNLSADLLERHERFYTTFAENAAQGLRGSDEGLWLNRLEDEAGNFNAIFARDGGNQLAVALHRYWLIRGYAAQGLTLLEKRLNQASASSAPAWQADATNAAGVLAWSLGRPKDATSWFYTSLQLLRQQDRPAQVARALNNLAIISAQQDELEAATGYFEESLGTYRQIGDYEHEATVLSNLSGLLLHQKEFTRARSLLEESLAVQRASGEPFRVASGLHTLAQIVCAQGEYRHAARLMSESLYIRTQLGDRSTLEITLLAIGNIVCELENAEDLQEQLTRLLHANLGPSQLSKADLEELTLLHKRLETNLGIERYILACQAGALLTAERVITLAQNILQQAGGDR